MKRTSVKKLKEIVGLLEDALNNAQWAENEARHLKTWDDHSLFMGVRNDLQDMLESDNGEGGLKPLLKKLEKETQS